ncbi:DNA internalization-related competence protein ComEC/Rec2 [Paenibacillus gansuensis]|uniref:DNA internalization-related competence protein ComEC/Rec2 n=1 Tax=Paenibacillus gansuensis TaxID=306542 RepID=A0ABW5PCL9_9BACL
MKRPLVYFTAAWIIGCWSALSLSGWEHAVPAAGLALMIPLLRHSGRMTGNQAIVCLLGFAAAAGYTEAVDSRNSTSIRGAGINEEAEVSVAGTIASPPQRDGDKVVFLVRTNYVALKSSSRALHVTETIQFYIRLKEEEEISKIEKWRRGDGIKMSGALRSFGKARNFGGFDYEAYMRLQKVNWKLQAEGAAAEVKPGAASPFLVLMRWNDLARYKLGGVLDAIFTDSQSGFMKSMLLGITDDMDPEQFRRFSKLGLTHILAISGLHVAVFVGSCTWLLRLLGFIREKKLIITLCLVPLYVLLTGASPSAIRSGIMAMIALYAARHHVLKDGLHIICAAALLMLIWNPYYLLNVSFQLSFIVTAGLILFVSRTAERIPLQSPALKTALSVTFVAQCISFPLTIFYFHQFSLLSFAANFILVPFMSFLILPAGTIALLIGTLHTGLGIRVASLVEWLNAGAFWFVDKLSRYSIMSSIWAKPDIRWIAAYYILFALLAAGIPTFLKRKGTAFLVAASLFCILLGYGYVPDRFSTAGLVQVLDVGQGDCILIRTPEGRIMLVDGGGTLNFTKPGEEWRQRRDPYEVGRKLVVPLLKQRGVHAIDYLIISHGDQDHIGGLQAVAEEIPVKHVIFNGTLKDNKDAYALFQTFRHKHIPLLPASFGNRLTVDAHTQLQFLSPAEAPRLNQAVPIEPEQNELSVIFLMRMHQSTFLFTGDAGFEAEQTMLEQLKKQPSEGFQTFQGSGLDVLKAGHHGSKNSTSEEFLRYWKPKSSVISAGVDNFYGHPAKELLERLQQSHTYVLRTDQMGEVQFKVSPDGLSVRTKLNEGEE